MTPDEFDKLRARSLTALHALYSAIHSTQDGEVPGDLGAYADRLVEAIRGTSLSLGDLIKACESGDSAEGGQ